MNQTRIQSSRYSYQNCKEPKKKILIFILLHMCFDTLISLEDIKDTGASSA